MYLEFRHSVPKYTTHYLIYIFVCFWFTSVGRDKDTFKELKKMSGVVKTNTSTSQYLMKQMSLH